MVTSVDQTIDGRKVFRDIEVPTPTGNDHPVNKQHLEQNFLNKLSGGQIGGDLDMCCHTIKYLKLDNSPSAAARVNELNLRLNRSGDIMSGDLDMNSNFVRNVGIDLEDNTAAMPKSYIDAISQNVISYPITADINLSNFKITNLKSPEGDNDAVNRGYLNQQISVSHVETSDKTNVFKYLNDPIQTSSERNIIVNSFGDWTNSPHKHNKRAYDVTLQRHSGADSYNSILGFNLYSAGAGKFTLVFEFHYPNVMSNISITKHRNNKQTNTKKFY